MFVSGLGLAPILSTRRRTTVQQTCRSRLVTKALPGSREFTQAASRQHLSRVVLRRVHQPTFRVATRVVVAAAAGDAAQDAAKVQPYRLLAYALIVSSLIPMVNPSLVVGGSVAPAVEAIGRAVGSCQIPGAFAALSLAEAAEHGRLTSDTYRRLNLSLILQAGLLAYGAAQGTHLPAAVCQAAVAGAAATLAICAWAYLTTAGVPALQTPGALLKGTAEVPGTVLKGLQAGGFASFYSAVLISNAPVAVILLALQQFAPLVVASGGDPTAAAAARLCGAGMVAGLGITFVQLDAALRDRLSASTFRALNWASLFNSATMGAIFLYPMVTGGIALAHRNLVGGLGVVFLTLAAVTVYILQQTQKKKN